MAASTEWREVIPPDEEGRFQTYAVQLAEMQKKKSEKFGTGRALHRKPVLGLKARLSVLDNLPEEARQGLFKTPGEHDALIRLSNGNMNVESDRKPDIRGFAVKIFGVSGPGALGEKPVDHQDFLFINHSAFSAASPDFFVKIILAAAQSPLKVIGVFVRELGFWKGLGALKDLAKMQSKPFSGFATETFFSALPFACGRYAARGRIVPAQTAALSPAAPDWAADVKGHLAKGPLNFDLQLQFFTDEQATPIENATVDWQTPYITVGKLTIPQQEFDDALQKKVEGDMFDPWGGLSEHRPLGAVMRARKAAYFESQKARGAVK